MISLASESINYMLGRRTTFADKARQTCMARTRVPPHLEGSVASCSVTPDRRFLVKHYAEGAREGLHRTSELFRSGGTAVELIIPGASVALAGLAQACLTETDAPREFAMQRAFWRFSKGRGVTVPKPIEVLHDGNGIVMQYLGDNSLRFSDCLDRPDLCARAVVNVSHMFFAALHEAGVVHGDISATNVLINLESEIPCLVDYGCCEVLADEGRALLALRSAIEKQAEKEPDTAYVISLWDHRKWDDDWAEKIDHMDVCNMQLSGGRAGLHALALLLRSIFALTMMARSVEPRFLREAEVQWRAEFPILWQKEQEMGSKLRRR